MVLQDLIFYLCQEGAEHSHLSFFPNPSQQIGQAPIRIATLNILMVIPDLCNMTTEAKLEEGNSTGFSASARAVVKPGHVTAPCSRQVKEMQ
jgi:hypothetical protein